jgi:hypothetical protein
MVMRKFHLLPPSSLDVVAIPLNARHKREQLVASRAPNGRVFDGDCYIFISMMNSDSSPL